MMRKKTIGVGLFFLFLTLGLVGKESLWATDKLESITTKLSIVKQKQGSNGDITVIVQLTHDKALPIPYASIQFSLSTLFGELILGSKPTDELGQATMVISGKIRRGDLPLIARYKGLSPYKPSTLMSELVFAKPQVTKTPSLRPLFPALVPFAKLFKGLFPKTIQESMDKTSPGSLITPYPSLFLVVSLMAIFFSIWSIYFYVIWLIWRIKKTSYKDHK